MSVADLLNWFAGGASPYMTLVHCMNHDIPWIRLTIGLDLLVATGYCLIALHWWRHEKMVPESPPKTALRTMKKIFVYCGLCGYVFIPIKMFWPAWRLYDVFLAVLAYYTWNYALRARGLRVVYEGLGRSAQLEEDLERSREEARRKSYFLNAVSHDLKTPLNGLLLQAELAELNLASNDHESLREALFEIKSCARTTADLLNRFLEIGRLDWAEEPSLWERVGVDELLIQVTNQARVRSDQKGLRLLTKGPSQLVIETDRLKLERILFNLVDNAIKFTQQGVIQVEAVAGAAEVRIHVEDSGPGIAVEHQAMIFEDFTQVENRERDSRKGFGLGLAIARRLAQQIGGDLLVQSEAGRGARFTIVLPAGESPAWVADPRSETRGPSFRGSKPAPRR